MFNKKLMVTAVSMALASTAFAQDEEKVLEEVIVTGVKYSLTKAVDLKRESMDIVDAIVAEDLGKFPDNNVVESMQRIPGIQVTDRGAGEVTGLSIRGLSDVTTTINGRNIFTASGRSVALQDIPSTLVSRVDVYKTRSAEHIARGVAGGIDIKTARPFDFEGAKVSASLRMVNMDAADETDPQASLLLSNRFDLDGGGEFGVLVNLSHTTTNYRDQGSHAGASFPFAPVDQGLGQIWGGWTAGLDRGLPYAPGSTLDQNTSQEFLHWRDAMFNFDFRGERKRPAGNIALQWAPNDTSTYTAEAFYTGYRVTTFNSLWFQFLNSPIYDLNDPVGIYEGTNVVRSRTMGDGFSFTSGDTADDKTDSYVYALRGDWQITDQFHLESEFVTQTSDFETEFWGQRVARIAPKFFIDINRGDGVPYLDYDPDGTGAPNTDPTNVDNYWLDWGFENAGKRSGGADTFTIDGDYDFDDGGALKRLSFGARIDQRDAEEQVIISQAGGPVNGYNLASPELAGMITYSTDTFWDGQEGVVGSWAIADPNFVRKNKAFLRTEVYGFPTPDYSRVFKIDERQTALYVQADFETELEGITVDGRAGVRYLKASTDVTAPGANGFVTDTNDNDAFLPSLMVRAQFTDKFMTRFSYTETFNLPGFGDLNPYIQYFPDVTDIGYGTASGGNINLKPEESENLDISFEYYFAEGSIAYATWFKRDITNRIMPFRNAVTANAATNDLGDYTYILSQPDNAGEASLDGWEFGLTWFPELEGMLNGLGVQASYTKLDSSQSLPIVDGTGNITGYDKTPLAGVSDDSYSVMLAYDREEFSARLSYFWRDTFYNNNEAALFANPLQVWRGEEESLDFQASWNFNENLTFTFDATNLTDPTFHWNYGNEPKLFNFHNYKYSQTYAFGVRYSM